MKTGKHKRLGKYRDAKLTLVIRNKLLPLLPSDTREQKTGEQRRVSVFYIFSMCLVCFSFEVNNMWVSVLAYSIFAQNRVSHCTLCCKCRMLQVFWKRNNMLHKILSEIIKLSLICFESYFILHYPTKFCPPCGCHYWRNIERNSLSLCACVLYYARSKSDKWMEYIKSTLLFVSHLHFVSGCVCVCVQICMRLCVCLCILPSSCVLWGNSVCSSCEASCVARTHKCGRSRAFSEYVDQLQRWRCGDGSDLNEAVSQCALALLVNSSSWATHTHNIHVVALL